MVVELVELAVHADAADGFGAVLAEASPIVLAAPGCRSFRVGRGVEDPHRFVVTIEWNRLEDHKEGFRASPAFAQWRAAIGPHLAAPPRMAHHVPS